MVSMDDKWKFRQDHGSSFKPRRCQLGIGYGYTSAICALNLELYLEEFCFNSRVKGTGPMSVLQKYL